MKAIGVIPARFQSTRFPGKVLALIQGRPMIEHVWLRARECQTLDDLVIACDDKKVVDAATAFGAKAVMTSTEHESGSDRIAEVVADLPFDIVVNIQGDEPFVQPRLIDQLVEVLKADATLNVATVVKKITDQTDIQNPNIVKVVLDHNRCALYFSRSPIPFNRNAIVPTGLQYLKHLGLYAYRKDFLMSFKDWPKSMLESTEQLEQLRILEAGYKIKTIETDVETIAVDTPDDLIKIKRTLNEK